MQKGLFIVAIIVALIGISMIPISQLPSIEMRERLVGKQIVQIPDGETSFEISLEAHTPYQLAIKGGLVAPSDPVRIEVLTPDNSTILVEFPREEPKSDFQTLASSGIHSFTFESAYAGANTRAEISEIVSWEVTTHPYSSFLYVGIAFVVVGTVFAVFGWIFPVKTARASTHRT